MEESASFICSNLSTECVLEELLKIISRTRGNFILTVCCPWSASKSPLDNPEVSSSRHHYFAWNSKKGDRFRWSLVHECGPWSASQVSSTKKRKNVIVSTRKRDFHNISCTFFLFLMQLSLSFFSEDVVSIK